MKRHFPSLSLAVAAALALAVAGPVSAGQRAVPRDRTDNGGSQDSGGGRAVPRGSGGGTSTSAPRPSDGGNTSSRPTTNNGSGDQSGGGSVPPYSRPREGRNPTGEAVSRPANNPPPGSGGTTIIVPRSGYYPWGWGYGGFGFGGYYGYYDPWWYDGYYAPYYAQSYYSSAFEGSLKLKIKPRDASVFVDGYFAGKVDDFDGIFQRLRVEPGPHRIEVRAEGYEPLTFEVRILPDRTVTYEGELKRLP